MSDLNICSSNGVLVGGVGGGGLGLAVQMELHKSSKVQCQSVQQFSSPSTSNR